MTPEQLKDLSPAPWEAKTANLDGIIVEGERLSGVRHMTLRKCRDEQDRRVTEMLATVRDAATNEFIALARNAFDVMMRRKWTAAWRGGFDPGWRVLDMLDDQIEYGPLAGDPFTALVAADAWYKANIEEPRR